MIPQNVMLHLPEDLKLFLAAEAEAVGVPLATYIRMLLVEHRKKTKK